MAIMGNEEWAIWQSLLGEWSGSGSGEPGEGAGSFTLTYDLDEKIVVRKNHVDYPATPDRPAFYHDDLMIIYPDSSGGSRAIYFDNEGHVIHYTVTFPDPSTIVFLSELLPSQPRFRLTYLKIDQAQLSIRFEIAPPDRPSAFNLYTEGRVQRNH